MFENLKMHTERVKWHDSDAPDANGKFRDLGINDLADWLIKSRSGDMQKITGALNQQIVFNRKRNPEYAAKMEKVRAVVKRKLQVESISEELTEGEKQKRRELYAKWRKLINMSAESLEKFKESQTAKGRKDSKQYPGLKPKEAAKIGIDSGVESANWIIKMKRTPVKDWTPDMWRWAGKQVSFVSRMLGNAGALYDEDGNPTRKLLSLKIWGHNPR